MLCRARADYKDKFIGATVKYGTNGFITCCLDRYHTASQRIFFFDLLGNGKLSVEMHLHGTVPRF